MTNMNDRPRFELLDGLRGIAAIAVLLFHLTVIGLTLSHYGYLAVDFFFLLSGFVMSHAYAERIHRIGYKRFVGVRLVRMLPLSVLGLSLGTAYFLIRYYTQKQSEYGIVDIVTSSLLNLFLIPKLWVSQAPTDTIFPTNTPLWSLSLELLLNLVWGYWLVKSKTAVLLGIVIMSAIVYVSSVVYFGTGDLGATWPTYIGGASRATFGFFAGVLLWRMRPEPVKSELLSFISIVIVCLCFAMPDIGYGFDIFVVLLIFPMAIFLASSCDYRKEREIFSFLGGLSFPLYAIHLPVLHFTVGYVKTMRLENYTASVAIVSVAGCLVASYVLDRAYDRPVRRLIGQRLQSR
jgi:peptidoglycan/LPS O-acetylase OafA/YrhL